jgi:glycosyltransferase involved in cell wall biosynthesis
VERKRPVVSKPIAIAGIVGNMNILLISPQPWGDMYVSKHHYAIALAALGHTVYFLNPPSARIRDVSVDAVNGRQNLFVVHSGFDNSLVLRYHFRLLYDLRVRKWLKKVLKRLPSIDTVWCFETNIISNLAYFGKMKKILHVVDPLDERMRSIGKNADLIVCVSNRILDQFKHVDVKKDFINHALSDEAIKNACSFDAAELYRSPGRKVGYAGNLFRQIIDTNVIISVVNENPGIEFHFWGSYDSLKNNLGAEDQTMLKHLQELPNVVFHGAVPASALIPAMKNMDAFLLVYKPIAGFYDSSNSHKLLEYWATGKVVISTYIDQYSGNEFNDFLRMNKENHNGDFPAMFTEVMNDLDSWNAPEKMNKRRDFALKQSYSNNAKKILAEIGE